MRQKAEDNGTDLLVIDTGDRVEGNGLYDSSKPPGIYTADILKQQPIDILCTGNHELYKNSTSEREYNVTTTNYKGNYLSSNVDIFDPETGELVPLAPRYKKFTTKVQGIRIVVFGFLFDFKGNDKNTIVHTVEETIESHWFQEAIREKDVDLFLVVGHIPAHSREYAALFKAIRSQRWDIPIQFFAGHLHIRDYAVYDSKAVALASGRFMETIGFMSISGLSTAKNPHAASDISFNRRYLDNNLHSFHHHTGLNETTFPTSAGLTTSKMIFDARKALNLDHTYGCVPYDLWMSRKPYPHPNSVYSWLSDKVLAGGLRYGKRKDVPGLAIVNTGGIRFDVFKGPFTRDAATILSPFTSVFNYIKHVPRDRALRLLDLLNRETQIFSGLDELSHDSFLGPPEDMGPTREVTFEKEMQPALPPNDQSAPFVFGDSQAPLASDGEDLLTRRDPEPGYTTIDDAGTDGDDTIHAPIPFYRVPNCFSVDVLPLSWRQIGGGRKDNNDAGGDDTIDLIYNDFLESWIEAGSKYVGIDYDRSKVDVYMNSTVSDLVIEWVSENWKCSR